MTNVAVLSDTHGMLRREVVAEIQDCAHIIHAGDIVKETDLDELRLYGSIYAVRGKMICGRRSGGRASIPDRRRFLSHGARSL